MRIPELHSKLINHTFNPFLIDTPNFSAYNRWLIKTSPFGLVLRNMSILGVAMESWYLLFCKSKQEQRAKINLQNQGFEVFIPEHQIERIAKGRRTIRISPLFPSYIFIKLCTKNCNFSAVKNTRGISGFVTYGQQFQLVSEQLIAQLKSMNDMCEITSALPKTGDVVYLNTESFKNVQAIYQEPDGDMRSILLINLLNKQISVSVENKEISL